MKTLYLLLGMLLGATLLGCAQPSAQPTTSVQPAVDLAAEEAAIRATDNQWLAAAKSRDPGKTASFWSDDAIIYPPNSPAIVGKQAIRSYVAEAFSSPDFSINWNTDKIVVSRSGDMAYATGSDQFTDKTADNKVVTERTHGVVVWRKQANGSWKAVIDIWSADAPAKPVSTAKKK